MNKMVIYGLTVGAKTTEFNNINKLKEEKVYLFLFFYDIIHS